MVKRIVPSIPCNHKRLQEVFLNHDAVTFSDEQIIALHETLMTPGFHSMRVNTVLQGRAILYTFLNSLHYYTDVACLTINTVPLKYTIFDLHHYLQEGGFLNPHAHADLEEFFLEQFESDFLWIEACPALTQQAWYPYFEQKLIELKINKQIPIMILSYA